MKGCRAICEQTVSCVKDGVLSALNAAGVSITSIPGLEESLSCTPDPFEKIDTAYLREKFYKKHFNYMVCLYVVCVQACFLICRLSSSACIVDCG